MIVSGPSVVEVSKTESSVLGFIFATSRWRSGCIEAKSDHFHCAWRYGTSQIHPKCDVHRVCRRIGCEGIGNRLDRAQSWCYDVMMSVGLYRIKYVYFYSVWWYGTSQIYFNHAANRVGVRLMFDGLRISVEIAHHRFKYVLMEFQLDWYKLISFYWMVVQYLSDRSTSDLHCIIFRVSCWRSTASIYKNTFLLDEPPILYKSSTIPVNDR